MSGMSPDSKVRGANMGPIWGRQDPGGPRDGPMNFAICVSLIHFLCYPLTENNDLCNFPMFLGRFCTQPW